MKIIARNKKASHDYFILEKIEVGIVLKGTEVKSVRDGKISIKASWCSFKNGEICLQIMSTLAPTRMETGLIRTV